MFYVYILQSECGTHFYVGMTKDFEARLAAHNAGQVKHTQKFKPWRIRTYVAFDDQNRAVEFERYLKSGSGRAFSSKRF
jgi:putative endonuclease